METMKLILKGIVFYTTMLLAMIYIMAIDSLSILATIGGFALILSLFLLCCHNISEEEYDKIVFKKFFFGEDEF